MIKHLPLFGTLEAHIYTYVFYIYALPMTSYLQGHLREVNISVRKGQDNNNSTCKTYILVDKIKLKATNRFHVDPGEIDVVWKSPRVSIFYYLDAAIPLSFKQKIRHLRV